VNRAVRTLLTHPAFLFAAGWAALLALLVAPLLAGGVLVNPMSDGKDGYVTRHFAAVVMRTWGEIPRWDPYIFGGMPFLGAMHGDQAYPISLVLRAVLTPALAIGLGMVFHLWLGAVGMLVFLRQLRHAWSAAIVGATAYGLGGPLIGLLFPGHDGKIYVLGLLPWGLTAVLRAARTARLPAFAGWGAVLGLMLLSPHFQMTYYASLLMGGFLVFCLVTETAPAIRWRVVAGMAVGSGGGLLLAGAQLLPFVEYLSFSPRSAAGSVSTGWAYATSWALPAPELIGTLWGGFNGWLGTYWGGNPFKLHSDYLGLLVVVLALTGLWRTPAGPQRRKAWFWAGAVLFGALWALGGQTPFYRLPYHLFPGIAKTRAPGMIWGQVSLAVAVLAAMGVSCIQAMPVAERNRWATRVGIATGVTAVLLAAATGSMLPALAAPDRLDAVFSAVPGARWGIVLGGFTVVAFATVAASAPRWLPAAAVALIALDLGIQDRRFIVINPRGDELFAADAVVQSLHRDAADVAQPWRVLPAGVYLDDYLIEHRIRSVLGYHGNELHRYDELLGGKNQWTRLGNPLLWRLLAVRYVLTDRPVDVPGLRPVAGPAQTWLGDSAWVWRVAEPAPWAWVVPLAIRVSDDQAHHIVVSPQFEPSRLALLATDAPFGTSSVPREIPPAISPSVSIRVTERQPGVYVLAVERLASDAVLVVSENWLPTWTARVDGRAAPVARANGTFLAIPLPAQSREVVLAVESPGDRRGRLASLAGLGSLVLLALAGVRRGKATIPATGGLEPCEPGVQGLLVAERALVIIPTYNERDNLPTIVPQVLAQDPRLDVLVVDDGSPDGTGTLADELAATNPRVHAIHRSGKLGLGTAYVAGFRWALERGYDYAFEMDADFSHDPRHLPGFLTAVRDADLVLGSRYLDGRVTVVNWPIGRLMLSYFANVYARWITGLDLWDATGGFKCYRRQVLEGVELDRVHSNGYSFQIEMSFRAWKKGFRLKEIPILFTDREQGASKMSRRIVWEAVWMVWRLRWLALTGRV